MTMMNKVSETVSPGLPSRIHMEHSESHNFQMPYMHTHVEYELLFVRRGRVTVENNIYKLDVHAPCLILHRPYMLHRACTTDSEGYERYVINFGRDYLERLSPWIPEFARLQRGSMTVIDPDEKLAALLDRLVGELWEVFCSGDEPLCQLRLAALLHRLSSSVPEGAIRHTEQAHGYIAEVMDYISRHFGECLQTEELAHSFFVSRGKLTSDFKEYTGLTVKQYVRLTRINIAKEMLISGRSISEIAQHCGFCDDSHFIRTFRALVGSTPKEFLARRDQNTAI